MYPCSSRLAVILSPTALKMIQTIIIRYCPSSIKLGPTVVQSCNSTERATHIPKGASVLANILIVRCACPTDSKVHTGLAV